MIYFSITTNDQQQSVDQEVELRVDPKIKKRNKRGKKQAPIIISFNKVGEDVLQVKILFKKAIKNVSCVVTGLDELECRADISSLPVDVKAGETCEFNCELISPKSGQRLSVFVSGHNNGYKTGKSALYLFSNDSHQKKKLKIKAVHKDGFNRPIRVFKGE